MKRQHGMTMISLMVGMTLSLVSIVGILSLYKSLVRQTTASVQRARQDGQITAALLSAQMAIQGAGYGVGAGTATGAANTDLLILTNAGFTAGVLAGTPTDVGSTSVSGNAVVWGETPPGTTYQCHAIVGQGGGLMLLTSSSGCSHASDFASATWTLTRTFVDAGILTDQADTVAAVKTLCAPFGKSVPASAVLATIGATSVTTNWHFSEPVCLSNLVS